MSVDTADTELAAPVKDAMLGRPNGPTLELLYQRVDALLDRQPVTLAAHAEAKCISHLLAKGMIGSHQVLEVLLELRRWGANFPLIDEHADMLNPLIRTQHAIWNNLVTIIREGEMPELPVALLEPDSRQEEQRAAAKDWWEHAASALQAMQELDVLPTKAVMEMLPGFVNHAVLKAALEGPYLLGYTLYVQQTTPSGARQSVDHNALVMLADTLAGAVITTHEKIRSLEASSKLKLIDRHATHLAWHMAVLRGFVVAVIEDRNMPLQHQLLKDTVVRGFVLRALQTVNEAPDTINWKGSSANPANMEVSSKAGGDLSKAFFDSIQKAADSPLNQTPR
jgi:hypothetical protein